MYQDFLNHIRNSCPDLEIRCREPLAKYTSFRIGGPAEYILFPADIRELAVCIKASGEYGVKYRVLGAGTNVLAPDEGLNEIVICLRERFSQVELTGACTICAMAGATLAKVAVFARDESLTGLEFAHGIPGTVGGGVYMNAGAYGGELSQRITSVTVIDPLGQVMEYSAEEAGFAYRHSIFQENGCVIAKAEFTLAHGEREEIWSVMQEYMKRRKASQPLELPSAGSTFKRPAGHFAGALIEQSGLKGVRVGGAQVSNKHAGFVVNTGDATSAEIKELIRTVQYTVRKNFGVHLEPEVEIW